MAKSKYLDRQLELQPGLQVPLRIYLERRHGYRATVGKKYLIFRIGYDLDPKAVMKKLEQWVLATFKENPQAFAHLLPVGVPKQGKIRVMDQDFEISLDFSSELKSHRGVADLRKSNSFQLTLTKQDKRPVATIVNTLLSRLFSQHFHQQLWERLQELNRQHFKVEVQGLRLKYTQTRWGSCSSKGNINLSSRLLLSPAATRDAVMIHELAHRIRMDHSPAYWALVYQAMPDYDAHHAWLKDHGSSLRFIPY
ncbi:MAG: M48 family metallopeptidase [Bacteroidota bacterium]